MQGPIALVNGVLISSGDYLEAAGPPGLLYIDASNGTILNEISLGDRVTSNSGPSIVDDIIYVGTGGSLSGCFVFHAGHRIAKDEQCLARSQQQSG